MEYQKIINVRITPELAKEAGCWSNPVNCPLAKFAQGLFGEGAEVSLSFIFLPNHKAIYKLGKRFGLSEYQAVIKGDIFETTAMLQNY